MGVNWRYIFVSTSIIMALTNCLQLLLVFGLNKQWGRRVRASGGEPRVLP